MPVHRTRSLEIFCKLYTFIHILAAHGGLICKSYLDNASRLDFVELMMTHSIFCQVVNIEIKNLPIALRNRNFQRINPSVAHCRCQLFLRFCQARKIHHLFYSISSLNRKISRANMTFMNHTIKIMRTHMRAFSNCPMWMSRMWVTIIV